MNYSDALTAIINMNYLIDKNAAWGYLAQFLPDIFKISLLMGFSAFMIKLLLDAKNKGWRFDSAIVIKNLIALAIITGIFCNPIGYSVVKSISFGLFDAFDGLFKLQMMSMKMDMRYFASMLAGHAQDSTKMFNGKLLDINVQALFMSVMSHLCIYYFYIIMQVGPASLVLTLAVGPLVGALSIVWRNLLSTWLMFIVSISIFQVFVGALFAILTVSDKTGALGDFSQAGLLMPLILLAFVIVFSITMLPLIFGTIFQAKPFEMMSALLALLLGFLGDEISPAMQVLYRTVKKASGAGK